MTATNEQIVVEAQRRFDENPGFESLSLIHYVIEVTREGWKPPEPVDPDVLAYREWEAVSAKDPIYRDKALAGEWDHYPSAKAFVAGARMAREQEQERAKALEGLLREIRPYSNFLPWFDLQDRFDALLKEAAR